MIRFFASLTALLVVLTMLVGVGAAENTTNETADKIVDAEENATNETDLAAIEDAERPIDSQVTLLEWRYEDGTFHLTFENEGRPTQITITEAVQFSEGSGQGSIVQERLLPGQSEVSVPVESVNDEAAVTMTTDETLQDGYFAYVSTGQSDSSDPFAATSSTAGWLGGAGTVMLMTVLAARKWLRGGSGKPMSGWDL